MASTSVSSVQGLASGIQWQDMVDQLSAIDKARELDPVTAAITTSQKQSDAWANYKTAAQQLSTAVNVLSDGSALSAFQVSTPPSATTGRQLFSATAQTGAVPGSYQVEVLDIARAEKLSGSAYASSSTVLGLTAGDIAVNGMKVSITAADTLNSIRDKINAINTGTNPSGVTATVLGTANGASRLVLSSDAAGAHGIELVDSASSGGVLQQLGLVDGSYVGGTNPDGSATSGAFSSTSSSVTGLLGLTGPPAATSIRIGNVSISVDLAVDSLDSIVAKITAAGVGARTTTTTTNGVTRWRLQVDAGLSAIPSAVPTVPDPDSLRVLQMLGVMQGGRSAIAQSLSSTALTDASNVVATGTTLLSDVKANGANANIQSGDSVAVSGKRGDGTAVSFTIAVGAGTTMNDLLTQLNAPGGFGGGTRSATATLGVDGKVHLADGTGGDSQLTMSLTVNKSGANGGGTTSVGAFGVETTGRVRDVTAGSDAKLRVDGVLLTRSSNTVSDAIGGVTLSLQQAEVNTSINVSVARDANAALAAVKSFASAYNALTSYVNSATATGGDLAHNTAIKASARSFTSTLLNDVTGVSLTRTALVGITLDKSGVLGVDASAFTVALQSNPDGVKSLFALQGTVSGTGLEYVGASDATQSGTYNVAITTAATRAVATGSGSTFPYVAGGPPTHLQVMDKSTGVTDSITLANGDGASAISAKLNTLFGARHMLLTASVTSGQVTITSSNYGSSGGFTLAYDAGDVTSATQLGLTAGTFVGLDVAGTINGVSATGSGQTLTGATGDATSGLVLLYTGTATGAIGTAAVTSGVANQMARLASQITRDGDGTVALTMDALSRSIDRNTLKSTDVQARLDRRKAALLKQFQAMELAIQRIQAQGTSLTNSINALTALQSNK